MPDKKKKKEKKDTHENEIETLQYPKPVLLRLIAVGFLLLPIFSTIFNVLYLDYQLKDFASLVHLYEPLTWAILLIAPVAAIGLLMVKRWGWFLLLAFSALIIIDTTIGLVQNPGTYHFTILIQTIAILMIIFFFFRRDIYLPYFTTHPRGWRLSPRKDEINTAYVDGKAVKALDLSSTGISVVWTNKPKKMGEKLSIEYHLRGQKKQHKGMVIRIEDNRLGILFLEN
jgi:hypothetical protein